MLPLQQAYESKHSIIEYLRSTFNFKDRQVQDAFDQFIEDPHRGLFKGPYVSLRLPFIQAKDHQDIPLDIKPGIKPYMHQQQAFARLTSKDGHKPLSTLVSTGTSSGKTECFLYPVLDYCHREMSRPGIKVIILYPMNALATDQAKRLAEIIWNDALLKGKLRAGLFIGEGKGGRKFPSEMGPDHVVENRDDIVNNPPDILLTNFKMLDYGLMKGRFHRLWYHNFKDPGLLRYLVLDELHTYDGAQGTDVANLIRRLKLKLEIPNHQLCAVGTSATMGRGPEAAEQLTAYASKVFGEPFGIESVITEHRMPVEDVFGSEEELDTFMPRLTRLSDSRMGEKETYATYVERQKRLWQMDPDANGMGITEELKKLRIMRDMVAVTHTGIRSLPNLIDGLAERNEYFKRLPLADKEQGFSPREEIVNSLLAIVSEAKLSDTKQQPFLFLQVQLWTRELSGLRRIFSQEPRFCWAEDLGQDDARAMPAYFCRECGSSGWLGYKADNSDNFLSDPEEVNKRYFENHKNIYFINTANHPPVAEYEPERRMEGWLDIHDLSINDKPVDGSIRVIATRKLEGGRARHFCPGCNTENSVSVIGTRVATLASVTVSQVLSSDLDMRPERFRKILAFTNSVQDAAHQAAFIEARNYRFTLRASLQKIINEADGPMDLDALQTKFITYWKEHSDPDGHADPEAYYHRFFPPDLKSRVDLASDYRVSGHLTAAFQQEFDLRMRWELLTEFGFNAGIGRTLEKTGTSACRLDEQRLVTIYPDMQEWLVLSNLPFITEDLLKAYVNGLVHRIRLRGGLAHPYLDKYRRGDFSTWELNWSDDDRHFLNRYFGKRARLPKLISAQPQGRGRIDSTHTVKLSWFRNYFIRSFPLASDYPALLNEFHDQLLRALVKSGILDRYEDARMVNHAIRPEALIVEAGVVRYACDLCGSSLTVASTDRLTGSTACLDYVCSGGKYKALPIMRYDYYRMVYNRNRSPRIYATEHTGLLERRDRENKERDFKERPRHDSLNTIVATSTLEMGIDIGTLNTVLNNSVPPSTANFLQRIGRAGRSSGSALIANFIRNAPHDLFYYEEPMDMMDGEIPTPGCFLEAKDILMRHYLAFCIDSWATRDPSLNNIPQYFKLMGLSHRDHADPTLFHSKLIRHMKDMQTDLLDRFTRVYAPDMHDPNVLSELRQQVVGGMLYERLNSGFRRVKDEYRYIDEKRKEIDDVIRQRKLGESDPARKELESDKRAFDAMKRMINNRSVAEYLTDTGLLPNYAFPETGVRLQSRIRSYQAKGSNALPVERQFEFVRSAATAIRELAPGNTFYATGFKHAISGLDTYDWREEGVLVRKRFCSQCDHIMDELHATGSDCPKCGDPSWGADRNRHLFLRMSGVKSSENRHNSTLDDASEERQPVPYRISRHILFGERSFGGAYALKNITFGIEYRREAEVFTANLGMRSSVDADNLIINGEPEVPRHGFITCRHCGRSTSAPNLTASAHDKYPFHYGYCKHREEAYKGKADEIFEQIYLYRSMKTEAIKVLLPVQEIDTEAAVNMFKAGIDLGLRKYFKGKPQHIETADYREFNPGNGRFDRYIVLYDSIPGGTGYVAKLFDQQTFMTLMRLAYESIRDCGCRLRGKDGCYRCIFTYTNQYVRDSLSRSTAETLFRRILENGGGWSDLGNNTLSAVSGKGHIEESELEVRFIRCLRKAARKHEEKGWQFAEENLDGVINYKLTTGKDTTAPSYRIQPQAEIRGINGSRVFSRADFLITLITKQTEKHREQGTETDETNLQFAIYLDGHAFHATKENMRIPEDIQTRSAIAASGQMLTWTLTWGDLDRYENAVAADRKDILAYKPAYTQGRTAMRQIPHWSLFSEPFTEAENSMDRLLLWLSSPLLTEMSKRRALAMSMLQHSFGHPSVNDTDIDKYLHRGAVAADKMQVASQKAQGAFFIFPDIQLQLPGFADIIVGIYLKDLRIRAAIHMDSIIQTVDKVGWEQFWQVYNMIQEEAILTYPDEVEDISTQPLQDLQMLIEIYDPIVHSVLRILHGAGIRIDPDGGFAITHEDIVADAHLGIKEKKVFFGPYSEEARQIFLAAGYRELTVEGFNLSALDE